jgi:hypothetical protein
MIGKMHPIHQLYSFAVGGLVVGYTKEDALASAHARWEAKPVRALGLRMPTSRTPGVKHALRIKATGPASDKAPLHS